MFDIEMIGAPSYSVAVDGDRFTYAAINGRLAELIGIAKADFEGKAPHAVLPGDYAETVVSQYRLCVDERRSVQFESFYDAPGGGRWWHTTVSPMFDGGEDGRVTALIGVAVDVTPRKSAEHRRRDLEARISLAMDVLEGGFWHYAIDKARFRTSPQLGLLVTGTEAVILDGGRYTDRVIDDDRGALDIASLIRGAVDTSEAEYRVRTLTGEVRWLSCKRRLTRDEAGRPENVIGVVVDITEQKLRQEVLVVQATTDSLTDLPNRRGFEAEGKRLISRVRTLGGSFGLILLDLDGFKPVNDTHGHAVGDAVLREVAARLRRHTRTCGVATRLGGDEFAILVEDAAEDVLAILASLLVTALARPISTEAGRVAIGVSIGVAPWRAVDGDLMGLMSRADEALLAVKRGGRGAWRAAT